MIRPLFGVLVLGLTVSACKQPFEPDGPAGNKLIVYGILNNATDTQYVRLATTYRSGISPLVQGASVSVSVINAPVLPPFVKPTIAFHDTVIDRLNAHGVVEHLPVYVAYHFRPITGLTYELSAQTASGTVSVRATTTTLGTPTVELQSIGALNPSVSDPILLNTWFSSASGAFELHFYVEFYAYINGGWELHREEVATRSYKNEAGDEVFVYPGLTPVGSHVGETGTAIPVVLDTTQYHGVLHRVVEQYGAPHVVFLQALFVMTQVDDVLYNYYYLNNGVIDQSSVRLDVPEFTNIQGGLGVFGSSVVVNKTYSLLSFRNPPSGGPALQLWRMLRISPSFTM